MSKALRAWDAARALGDPEQAARLGRWAARLVEENYSYERFRSRLLAAYQAIL
jgi:glycosyltransferase involved in cell wall biosynthesis